MAKGADKDRIILLQKQLKLATKALKDVRDNCHGQSFYIAREALDDIERVRIVQEGRFDV